ncbi:MAG: hypothetical protein ND866_27270 [Pyrinomonadaceae bacterium]|nr:hypothetical protein [Pyrinomonadaceae bacterium]
MKNGTNLEEIKEDLDDVFEAFYTGLLKVAVEVRQGASPTDIANEIDNLAFDFCKHWPTCRIAHNLDYPARGKS